ncbi:Beta-lactamase-like precursor [uncultured Candidatus Thioglobus sp.]|nr:Beta-lactamase-like precursor [uncultured Candidatus Thioglobus sp.]
MKKIFLIISIALLVVIGIYLYCYSDDYKFEKIADNVYVMQGSPAEPNPENKGFMNNPGFIIGDSGAIIIDPGSTYQVGKMVLEKIKKITDKPIVAVFNTHIHGDHWLGNQAVVERYPNVKIYAHPTMISRAKEGRGQFWVDLMEQLTEGLSTGTVPTYPTDATTNLQIINAGGETFKMHHNVTNAAHTNTDLMVEHLSSKTLFLGDNDFLHRHGRFDSSSDMHGNIKTLKYALDLGLTHYVPGHGKPGNAKTAVQPFLDYLLIVQDVTKKGYKDDLADYEIKPIAHKKLVDYRDWHGYDVQLGKHISKMLLEIEALDF